jgi:hypothetical protein
MAEMTTSSGPGPKHRRRRRHGHDPAPPASPVQVLAQAGTVPELNTFAELPLSPQEVAQLKVHFRFLREHRNVLKLRVNAAEDLLLNGVKEPTHRGVCRHLLAKVERSRVLAVSQTLPPAETVRLLSGIIRFAPEIGYILRFLECVKLTSSQHQAGAALTEALKQIDYSELSAAQMRQLVALIVDVFAERDLPVFLFALLNDLAFKSALDRSLDDFPEVLGRMVRPLRALHDVIAQRSSKRPDASADLGTLKAGVGLLLDVNPLSLVQLPEFLRRRLFQLGCETLRSQPDTQSAALLQILSSLSFSVPAERTASSLALASAMLAAGHESLAKQLLEGERKNGDSDGEVGLWCDALVAPRIASVALDPSRSNRELPSTGRWYRGWHLPTQSSVLVRHGEPGDQPHYAEQIALWRRLLVPGASRVVQADAEPNRRPFIAVELQGLPLNRHVSRSLHHEQSVRLRWAIELCALLSALADQGVALQDAELHRFNTDPNGRLWLVDLWPLCRMEPNQASLAHLRLARQSCRQLLRQAPCYSLPTDAVERLEKAGDLAEVARIFEIEV